MSSRFYIICFLTYLLIIPDFVFIAQETISELELKNNKLLTAISALENEKNIKVLEIENQISIINDSITRINKKIEDHRAVFYKINNKIREYAISEDQESAYYILLNQTFLEETTKGFKKLNSLKTKLAKTKKIDENSKLLITTENNYWYNSDNTGRLISLKNLNLEENHIILLTKLKDKAFVIPLANNKIKLQKTNFLL